MKRNYLIVAIQTLTCLVFITSTAFAQATVINRATQILTNGTVYNIQNKISNKMMDVSGGSPYAGSQIWQYDLNQTDAQKFTFVDAGNGAYYIITKSNLYVTIKFNGQLNPDGRSATPSTVNNYILIQDNKNTNNTAACNLGVSPTMPCPNNQKWRLIPVPNDNRAFIIQSVAFSTKVLQPVNNNSSSSIAMVIGNNGENQKWIISEPTDLVNSPIATQEEITVFNQVKNNQSGVGVLGGETTKPFYYDHPDPNETVYKYKKKTAFGELDAWFPLYKDKKTLCGKVENYGLCTQDWKHDGTINRDKDANLDIIPNASFASMSKNYRLEKWVEEDYYRARLTYYRSNLKPNAAELAQKDVVAYRTKYYKQRIECEFEPDMNGEFTANPAFRFTSEGFFKQMVKTNQEVCVYGPWMWDRVVGKPVFEDYLNNEIHPVNQFWYKKGVQTTLIALVDESGFFNKTGNGQVEASGLNQRMSFYVAFEIPYSQLNSAVSLTQYQNMVNYNINGVAEDFTLTPINNVQQEILVLKYKGYDILRLDDNSIVRLQKTHRVFFDKVRKAPNGSIQGYIVVETEPMTRAGGSINIVVTNN